MCIILLIHSPFHANIKIITPDMLLIVVFFLELTERCRLSSIFLILIGLFNDYLDGSLIGLTSLQLCILKFLIKQNQKAVEEQKFGVTWIAFSLLALILYILKVLALSVYGGYFILNAKILMEMCLTITFYPIVHIILSKIISLKIPDHAR